MGCGTISIRDRGSRSGCEKVVSGQWPVVRKRRKNSGVRKQVCDVPATGRWVVLEFRQSHLRGLHDCYSVPDSSQHACDCCFNDVSSWLVWGTGSINDHAAGNAELSTGVVGRIQRGGWVGP